VKTISTDEYTVSFTKDELLRIINALGSKDLQNLYRSIGEGAEGSVLNAKDYREAWNGIYENERVLTDGLRKVAGVAQCIAKST